MLSVIARFGHHMLVFLLLCLFALWQGKLDPCVNVSIPPSREAQIRITGMDRTTHDVFVSCPSSMYIKLGHVEGVDNVIGTLTVMSDPCFQAVSDGAWDGDRVIGRLGDA